MVILDWNRNRGNNMIKQLIISNSIKTIRSYYPNYNNEQIEKIQYGLESIYLSITKLIVILLMSVLLKSLKETIIVLLLFNLLRTTGFGIHASKSWMCWISSVPTFIGVPLLCKYINIPTYILICIASISLLIFILFAPADTKKRPLIRKKKRVVYKVLTIIIGFTYLMLIIFIDNTFLKSTLSFSMLIEAILICPLTYKLFNMPFNNYKNYKL